MQTSYSMRQAAGILGLIYAQHPYVADSRSVETAAGIGFGLAVSRGTDKENQVVLGGESFFGITLRSIDREGIADGTLIYNQYETAAILRDGYVWVTCPTGCNPGDTVNYNTTTGVIDSGTAEAGEVQLNGSTWESVAAAGELAVLRLNTAQVNS